jgi:hypothetical protein
MKYESENEISSSDDKNSREEDASNVMLEIVSSCLLGRLDVAYVVAIFHQIKETAPVTYNQVIPQLQDAVWFWGVQIPSDSADNTIKAQWTTLCSLVKELLKSDILQVTALKLSLDLPLLLGAGISTEDPELTKKRAVKINTRILYRQEKFNILREETEGYSKLFTILSAMPPPNKDPSAYIRQVEATIGCFDLDPNR